MLIMCCVGWTMTDMTTLIDVPAGLNGVVAAETSIGDVLGDEGRYHYRGHDAPTLARDRSFDEVWHLLAIGHLPDAAELTTFRARTATARRLPPSVAAVLEPMARATGATLGRVRAALSLAAADLGLRPLIDLDPAERAVQAESVAAVVPVIVAALHRASVGLAPVPPDDDLGHAAAYLHMVTGAATDGRGGSGAGAVLDPHDRPRLQRLHLHRPGRGFDRRRPG